MVGFGGLENVTLLNNYGSLFGYPFVIFPGVQMIFPISEGDFLLQLRIHGAHFVTR